MRLSALTLLLAALLVTACGPAATATPAPTQPPEGLIATPPHATPTEVPSATAAPTEPGLLLEWQNDACNALQSDGRKLSYGRCDGQLTDAPATDLDLLRLGQWRMLYAPFQASLPGPAGMQITLNGQGTLQASTSEQRAIAEWASLRYDELESGRSGAAWSLALDWNRQGGIAGFCDEVTVLLTGDYDVSNCKTPPPTAAATLEPTLPLHLSPTQLDQLYGWYDTLETFDYEHTDPATADALTIKFTFQGNGTQPASEQDIQAINDFAYGLMIQASQGTTPSAVSAAQQDLAGKLGIPMSQITVVSMTPVEWPDSCLGVSTPGIMCAQIVTSGYLIVLEAEGTEYNYHTDLTGENIILAP
jgi:hypothetical protein